MGRRRRLRRRTKSPLVRAIAIGVLLLWAGLLFVGIFGHDEPLGHNPADLGPSTRIIKPELDPQQLGKAQGHARLLARRDVDPSHEPSSRNPDLKDAPVESSDVSGRALAQEVPPLAPAREASPPAPSRNARLADGELGQTKPRIRANVGAHDSTEANGRSEPERSTSPDQASVAAIHPSDAVREAESQRQATDDAAMSLHRSDVAPLESAPEAPANVSSPNVPRAQFTTGIEAREPIDRVGPAFLMHGKPLRTLYYFTEMLNMGGQTITHRWMHEGAVVAEIPFHIGGDHWRVYSSKDLSPAMQGQWQVVVTDTHGDVIKSDSFTYRGP